VTTVGWKKPACKRGHVDPERYASGACVPCRKAYALERYRLDPEMHIRRSRERARGNPEARRDEQRACRLGASVAEVRDAIQRAAGKREACGKAVTHASLCVDHCHTTGRVRGVLCRFCNALEGMLNKQADRVALLRAYLDREIERREKAAGAPDAR
jgi:hypothetical protein